MRLLLATLLAANAAAGSLAIAAPKPEIETKAEHVFKKADGNQDGVLNAAEQAKAQPLALDEIKNLLHHIKHPLPAVPAPKLADRNAMTAAEFVQCFKSLAGREDAARHTKKIITQFTKGGVFGSSRAPSGVGRETVYYLKPDPPDEGKTENPVRDPGASPPNVGGAVTNPGGVAPRPPVFGPAPGVEPTVPGRVKEPQHKNSDGNKGGKGEPSKNTDPRHGSGKRGEHGGK
jgi:hypothetical protein